MTGRCYDREGFTTETISYDRIYMLDKTVYVAYVTTWFNPAGEVAFYTYVVRHFNKSGRQIDHAYFGQRRRHAANYMNAQRGKK